MPRTAPALAKATTYLRGLIARTTASGKSRLPTVDALAAGAHVSRGTMLRAVRAMKLRSVVSVSHGRGITIIGRPGSDEPMAPPVASPPPKLRTQWARIAEAIKREALTGVYAHADKLPSAKELTARYGTCHRTLQRALRLLIDDGVLERFGQGYRVVSLQKRRGAGTVVLMLNALYDGRLALEGPWRRLNLRTLERGCARLGVNLATVPLSTRGGRRLIQGRSVEEFREVSGVGTVLGHILWAAGWDAQDLTMLVERLNRTGTPVALLDERGDHSSGRVEYAGRRLQVFTLGMTATAGLRVGEALLGLGHRKIAFIWPNPGAQAFRKRLEGLTSAFVSSGNPDGVRLFTTGATTDGGEMSHGTRSAYKSAGALFEKWFRHPLAGRLVPHQERLPLERHLRRTISRAELRRDLDPLFAQALSDSSITTWVCNNDSVATVALDYLKEAGRSVPEEISVVGFDNSPEALDFNLTSYDFNAEGSVLAMLHYALGTLWPTHRKPGTPVEMDGFLVERGTLARARPGAAS